MEIEEHFYQDNPRLGPVDAWTTLPGVNYYFLGNGLIQAAVQVCSKGSGTPVGLLLMDPEKFGPKSGALSLDPASGLRPTMVTLQTKEGAYSPLLDQFYESCIFELQASIAASGKLDGSIWQYNREWTRDQAMASIGLTLSGQFELARKLLSRLLGQFVTEAGDNAKVWRILRWLGKVPGSKAGSWFEFYGPRPIPPYPQIGIVPWTWVELLILFIHHLLGVRPEWPSLWLRPRLLSGLPGFRASLRIRGFRVNLTVKRAKKKDKPGFLVNGKSFPYAEEGLRLPYTQKDLCLKAWIPPSPGKIKN
jgi:hypothetical protein